MKVGNCPRPSLQLKRPSQWIKRCVCAALAATIGNVRVGPEDNPWLRRCVSLAFRGCQALTPETDTATSSIRGIQMAYGAT